MVARLLNINPENFLLDATDALAIAITHVNQSGLPQEVSGGWDKFLKANADRIKNP